MTRWGALLIVLFVAVGLSKKPESKAVTIAVWASAVIVTVIMAKTVR